MVAVTTVIAVAVSCSVLFVVAVSVGIAVWWRLRHDRLSLAMAEARGGVRYTRRSHSALGSIVDLSRDVSSLRSNGQLPYAIPYEWTLLGSKESFHGPKKSPAIAGSEKLQKTKSLRHSLSKSKAQRGLLQKPIPLSSLTTMPTMTTMTTMSEKAPTIREPDPREKEPVSTIEGVSELPAEQTPRHTPEKDKEKEGGPDPMPGRPASTAWPLQTQAQRSSAMPESESQFGMLECPPLRVRGGSITAQSPGAAPEQPMPPPPVAYLPNRYYMTKNDSLLRLSSLSLDTADSSILDDGMRTSMSGDSEWNSPALPPCPTFGSYNQYSLASTDRNNGRFSTERGSLRRQPSLNLQFTHPAPNYHRRTDPMGYSPRRSLTTRQPGYPLERISEIPRRSGTVFTPPRRRDNVPTRARSQTTSTHPSPNSSPIFSTTVGRDNFTQYQVPPPQRYTMYEGHRARTDQLIDPSILRAIARGGDLSDSKSNNSGLRLRDSPGKAPLPSALKGSQAARKGHRRQNCVRISIHPPITFGGPVFSPTIEEPEDIHELDKGKARISDPPSSNRSSFASQSSPSKRQSRHHSTDVAQLISQKLAESPDPNSPKRPSNTSRKRRYSRGEPGDDPFKGDSGKNVSEMFSTVSSMGYTLSRTPSPEKTEPVWTVPYDPASPKLFTNSPLGSPRRSAVRGPRSQPAKSGRNSISSTGTVSSAVVSPLFGSSNRNPPSTRPGNSGKSTIAQRRMNFETKELTLEHIRNLTKRNSNTPSPRMMPGTTTKKGLASSASDISIWEDASVTTSPTKGTTLSPIGSEDLDSFNINGIDSPITEPPPIAGKKRSRASVISTESSTPQGFTITTPKGKTMGLGIGCATPASLYDRDGFLKE
ncbi:hypothetical protein Plec18170_005146 [Paecilomyces lecythidis]